MKQYILCIGLILTLTIGLSGCAPETDLRSEQQNDRVQSPEYSAEDTRSSSPSASPTKPKEKAMQNTVVQLKTSKGIIEIELYPEKAPKTVENFLSKAQSGFYTNLKFHRVEDWVIQGGDPLGNGTGGGKMPTELSDLDFVDGSLGVARGGDIKVSNDAQFFICTKDCGWLTGQYTNFGKVIKGLDVAKKIAIGDTIGPITIVEPKK